MAWAIGFYIYLGKERKSLRKQYGPYAKIFKPQYIDSMLIGLSRHDWGLVGNLGKFNEWKVALPNKFFEYLAAGIPVVSINADECDEIIKEHGVGISVKNLYELKDRWGETEECRKNVVKNRNRFAMENKIGSLETFYRDFL